MNQAKPLDTFRIASGFRKVPKPAQLVILLALVAFSVYEITLVMRAALTGFQLDLHVFQDSGQAFIDGAPLYGPDFPDRQGFPFIYPPVAALFFVPLTWGTQYVIQGAWTVTSLIAIWAILSMTFARILPSIRASVRDDASSGASILGSLRTGSSAMLLGFAVMGIALVIDPMQRLFQYGQIDILLALLIVADALGFTPKWSRGILIGFAAGVKITPAAFALLFLARKEYFSILRSIGGLVIFALAGFLIRPQDSFVFWTEEVFDSERAGLPAYEGNQALSGLIRRSGLTGEPLDFLILALFLLGGVLAYLLARKLLRSEGFPQHQGFPQFQGVKQLQDVQIVFVIGLCLSLFGPYTVSNHSSIVIIGIPLAAWVGWEYLVGGIILYLGHYFADNYKIFPQDGHVPVDFQTLIVGNTQGELTLIAFLLIAGLIFLKKRRIPAATTR